MNLLSLDIRMLRSLISVADTGSVTETARRLGRSQPAISLQIQRLEDITGKRGKTSGGMILRFSGGRESDSFWEWRRPGILTVCRTPS